MITSSPSAEDLLVLILKEVLVVKICQEDLIADIGSQFRFNVKEHFHIGNGRLLREESWNNLLSKGEAPNPG